MDYIHNGTSINTNITWNATLLRILNADMFRRLSPVVTALVIIMVVGTFGNILICYIFITKLRKNSQNFLLLCLGTFDLLSSCVGVPSEIMDISQYYMYESVEVCKATRFLTTFPSLASIMVLIVIAADRYRKICKPLYHQIHLFHTRIALLVIIVAAAVLSVPALYIYGHRTLSTPIPGQFGCDCSVIDAYQDELYPLIYEGAFFAAFVICTAVLVFIYARIWLETKRHIRYLKKHAMFGTGVLDETITSSSATFEEAVDSTTYRISKQGSEKSLVKFKRKRQIYDWRHGKGRRKRESIPSEEVMELQASTSNRSARIISDKGDHYTEPHLNDKRQCGTFSVNNRSNEVFKLDNINEQAQDSTLTPRSQANFGELSSQHNIVTPYTGTISGTIILGNMGTCESSTDDIDIQQSGFTSDKPGSDGHVSCSNTETQDHQNLNATSLCCDQDIQDTIQLQNEPKVCYQQSAISLSIDSNDQTELKCSNKLNSHAIPLQYLTDKQERGEQRTILQNHLTYNDPSQPECSTHSLEKPKFAESLQVSNKDIHKSWGDHDHSTNNSIEIPHTNDALSRHHQDLEPTNVNKSYISNKNDHIQETSFENQERNSTNNTEVPSLRINRISFANELNILDYEEARHDSQEHPLSSDIPNQEIQSHKPLEKSKSTQSLLTTKRARKALRATRTTIIAFTITLGFVLSYLPHLTLIILRSVRTNFDHELDDVSLNMYNLFLRSYFVNNVINVFVYGCMHLEFRIQIGYAWKKIKCLNKE